MALNLLTAPSRLFPVLVLCAACSSSRDTPGNGFPDSPDASPPGATDTGRLGSGRGPSDGGGGGSNPEVLTAIVRDFKRYDANDPSTNPDFENVPKDGSNGPWDDRGIVESTLGTDDKPVYKSATGTTFTTHGKAAFDQWYRDVPGTNVHVDHPLTLVKNTDGTVGYDSEQTGVVPKGETTKMFFPVNDGTPQATPFGNQGDTVNYAFTVEIHTRFTYSGGEFFKFRGDDDVFVFIDRRLAIDLGGIHPAEAVDVNMDTLGLEKGREYPLDFFFAERHKVGSNVLFTTSLNLRAAPPR